MGSLTFASVPLPTPHFKRTSPYPFFTYFLSLDSSLATLVSSLSILDFLSHVIKCREQAASVISLATKWHQKTEGNLRPAS